MNGTNTPDSDAFLRNVAAELDVVDRVPDDCLREMVTQDGSCMEFYRLEQEPDWSNDLTDRQTAARICLGCPVQRECLELELRSSGAATLGVWGALSAEDVRDLHPIWRARREHRPGGERA